jgi:hypothetical protein
VAVDCFVVPSRKDGGVEVSIKTETSLSNAANPNRNLLRAVQGNSQLYYVYSLYADNRFLFDARRSLGAAGHLDEYTKGMARMNQARMAAMREAFAG